MQKHDGWSLNLDAGAVGWWLRKIRGREGEAFVAARQADGLERQSDERVQQVIKLVEDLQRRLAKAEPAKPASTYIELGHAVRTE
jgi:hypothetical protein